MLSQKIKRRLKGNKMGELFCAFTYRNKDGKSCLSNRVSIEEAIERLHQYEDSGLSPNQVEAMVNKAEYKAPLTARWIRWGGEREYDWIKCENCHNYRIACRNKYPNFCENCGADMRIEDVFAPDRGCAVDAL